MGILDSFRQSKEKSRDHAIPPKEGHTLAEILKDKKNSHLFGKLLDRYGREDLALRLMKGELKENDISLLEEERLRFEEIMARSEKIKSLLTEEGIIEIAQKHPEFEKIINLIGPEKAKRVIQSQLDEIAFTDEYRFDRIADGVEEYDSYKNGKYKEVNNRVEQMCADGKFTPQEYLDTLAITDRRKKAEALKELANRKHGKFKKVINFCLRGKLSKNRLEEMETSEALMGSSIDELNSFQEDIGSELFFSVDTNEYMRDALSSELIGERAPEEPKLGFGDIKRESSATFNQGEFDVAWNDFKKKEAYEAAYDYEQDSLKDKFIEEQKQKYKEKNTQRKGFWAGILATLFEGNINSKKATLE